MFWTFLEGHDVQRKSEDCQDVEEYGHKVYWNALEQ